MTALTEAQTPREASGGQAASHLRNDIQGLRAVAVLAVVADHLFDWPNGGFVGVDIFFVISGYLITGLLLREHQRTGGISYRSFYIRRVKRILPASTLVLAATAAASFLLLGGQRLRDVLVDALWALGFSGNWRFAVQGTDYFQEGLAPSPLQHYWSLGVEEQFYFVWPWIMLALLLLAARRGLGRGMSLAVIAVVMLAITIASFTYAMGATVNNPSFAYFSTFSRAWELGAGALAAIAAGWLRDQHVAQRTVLAWVGLGGIVASVLMIDESQGFPAPAAALPVLATVLVIAAGEGGEQRFLWPLTNRASRYVGDISYSLYLWHWPVIVLLVAVLPSGTLTYYAVALALAVGLSIASYHLVEDPVRRSAWLEPHKRPARAGRRERSQTRRWESRQQDLSLAALAVACVALAVVALRPPEIPVAGDQLTTAGSETTQQVDADPDCLGAAVMDATLACANANLGDTVRPDPDSLSKDTGDAYKCYVASGKQATDCSIGSTAPDATRVALIGDSHAAALVPALRDHARAANWKIDLFVGNGCQWRPTTGNCSTAMKVFQERLLTGEPYAVVMTSASREYGASPQEYAASWRPVASRGSKILVIADVPQVALRAMECVQRVNFDVNDNDCVTDRQEALATQDRQVQAAALVPGSAVVDLSAYFCNEAACPAVIGNVIVYRDTASHVTATYAKTLAPYLAKGLQEQLG